MKQGYTLAELLITLGIIAVISAIMGVAITGLRPDETKIKYLKRYDSVVETIKDLAGNSNMFPVCDNNLDCKEHPLFNSLQPVSRKQGIIGAGDEKLCRALSYMFNGNQPNLNCTQPNAYQDGADWTPSFTTKNRTQWLVSTTRAYDEATTTGTYQTDIYFDINGSEAPNCIYNADTCKTPDRFKLMVSADGRVQVADPVGRKYLLTRKNLKKQSLDIEEGESVLEQLNNGQRTFQLSTCVAEAEAGGGNEGGEGYSGGDDDDKDVACGSTYKGFIVNCIEFLNFCDFDYTWSGLFKDDLLKQTVNNTTCSLMLRSTLPPDTPGLYFFFNHLRILYNFYGNEYQGKDQEYRINYPHTQYCKINVGETECKLTINIPYKDEVTNFFLANAPTSNNNSMRMFVFDEIAINTPESGKMIYVINIDTPGYNIWDKLKNYDTKCVDNYCVQYPNYKGVLFDMKKGMVTKYQLDHNKRIFKR